MDNQVYLSSLYDYYGTLLTNTQQAYFEDYYFNNLSLQEISENNNVSRNAVHKCLKEIVNRLNYYEEVLKLYEKGKEINKLIENIDDNIKERIKELI